MTKKSVFLAIFGLLIAAASFSQAVGILVIQDSGNVTDVRATSYIVENTLLDTFFDNGYIVSNNPIALINSRNTVESLTKRAIRESNEGQMDILIVIKIKYKLSERMNTSAVLLSDIEEMSYEIYNVLTSISYDSKNYVPNTGSSRNNEDGVKTFTQILIKDLLKSLRAL